MKTRCSILPLLTLAFLVGSFVSQRAGADPIRVLVHADVASALAELEGSYPDLQVVPVRTDQELVGQVANATAVVALSPASDISGLVRAGRSLRWIQTASAGVENFLRVPELAQGDIVLTNAKIVPGPEIADHAMGLLLNLTRDLKAWNEQMPRGFDRSARRLPLIELRGKTALVIGLGGIGTQVAQRAAAFGMRVLAVDPKDIPLHRDVARVAKPDELGSVLPEADVVFICAPWTPATEGMLGEEQFGLMRDGVYVINVSRGALIDTDALVAALRSGKVRAAGLDVTHPEPLPADHPLWSMPNVTITPHIAGRSDALMTRRIELFRDNLDRFLSGRELRNVVDKEAGF